MDTLVISRRYYGSEKCEEIKEIPLSDVKSITAMEGHEHGSLLVVRKSVRNFQVIDTEKYYHRISFK